MKKVIKEIKDEFFDCATKCGYVRTITIFTFMTAYCIWYVSAELMLVTYAVVIYAVGWLVAKLFCLVIDEICLVIGGVKNLWRK